MFRPMESLSRFVARSITVVGSIGGAACAVIANASSSATWQGLAVVGFGTALAGGIGWFRADKKLKRDYAKRQEQRMIATAKKKNGRVTDVELVSETRYSLEECRAFLKAMTESGSAEMHIGKEGTMVYLFPGFLSEEDKRKAQSAAEWMPEVRAPRKAETSGPPPLGGSERAESSNESSAPSKSLELE